MARGDFRTRAFAFTAQRSIFSNGRWMPIVELSPTPIGSMVTLKLSPEVLSEDRGRKAYGPTLPQLATDHYRAPCAHRALFLPRANRGVRSTDTDTTFSTLPQPHRSVRPHRTRQHAVLFSCATTASFATSKHSAPPIKTIRVPQSKSVTAWKRAAGSPVARPPSWVKMNNRNHPGSRTDVNW
jgi:hypothetical protein